MSLTLRQTTMTQQSVDMHGLLPQRLSLMDDTEIRRMPLHLGNQQVPLSDLFAIERNDGRDDTLFLIPQDDKLDHLGAGMSEGRVIVRGDAGRYAGRAMLGGSLSIEGSAGDFAGSSIAGGTLSINGNAGNRVGAPAAGEPHGQSGGFIHVYGNAGERAGERQRRGVLLINGNAGPLLGHRMIAGTLYVGGYVGEMAGYGMRRGTLLLRHTPKQVCETMSYNGRHRLNFLYLLMKDLQQLSNNTISHAGDDSVTERHVGDLACGGRGEILVLQ